MNDRAFSTSADREPEVAARPAAPDPSAAHASVLLEQILYEVKRVVVGQERFLQRMLIAMLAGGHVLAEGLPGLAKTLAVKTFAQVVHGIFRRVQFTPDLVPADLVGTRIYNQKSGEFTTSLGPVFANLLLADEINRAPAKVQSALLEVMQEHQVTIAGETYRVPEPFLVLATQNPIESEGTFRLPEAQLDRFMMKVLVDYPSHDEEYAIVERSLAQPAAANGIVTIGQLATLQEHCRAVYVDPACIRQAVDLVAATREPERYGIKGVTHYLQYGASPRASIQLVHAARAAACLRGRDYTLPEDLAELAPDVLRHRLVLSYEAHANAVDADEIIRRITARVLAH